jgi:hypothetical protein
MSEQVQEKGYSFDAKEFTIEIIAKPANPEIEGSTPKIVSHKLKRPTFDQLAAWEKAQAYETLAVSSRESEIISDATGATLKLWDECILSIKGYRINGSTDWRDVGEPEKREMSFYHKLTVIHGLYLASASIDESYDEDEEEGVSFGGARQYRVKHLIGTQSDPYVAFHTFREPSEVELKKFSKSQSTVSAMKGAKKQRLKYVTSLKAYVDTYDLLILTVESGSDGNGGRLKHPPSTVDPIFKQQALQCLIDSLGAQLQD